MKSLARRFLPYRSIFLRVSALSTSAILQTAAKPCASWKAIEKIEDSEWPKAVEVDHSTKNTPRSMALDSRLPLSTSPPATTMMTAVKSVGTHLASHTVSAKFFSESRSSLLYLRYFLDARRA